MSKKKVKYGRKAEKSYSFKYINNTEYLYIWRYDKEGSDGKRKEMRENGIEWEKVSTDGSRYKWISLGKFSLEDPSPKLAEYLENKSDEFITQLEDEYQQRKVERFKKRMEKRKSPLGR